RAARFSALRPPPVRDRDGAWGRPHAGRFARPARPRRYPRAGRARPGARPPAPRPPSPFGARRPGTPVLRAAGFRSADEYFEPPHGNSFRRGTSPFPVRPTAFAPTGVSSSTRPAIVDPTARRESRALA